MTEIDEGDGVPGERGDLHLCGRVLGSITNWTPFPNQEEYAGTFIAYDFMPSDGVDLGACDELLVSYAEGTVQRGKDIYDLVPLLYAAPKIVRELH